MEYGYLKESTFNDYVRYWVDGDDLDSIRNLHSAPFYKRILSSPIHDVLYRYIDNSEDDPSNYDSVFYTSPIGSSIVLDLMSTTTSNPRQAWDEWYTPGTDVIRIEGARGIDVQDYGGNKFPWEKEILTCGEFVVTGRKKERLKGTRYNLITLEYIGDTDRQKEVLMELTKNKLDSNRTSNRSFRGLASEVGKSAHH